MTPDQVRGRLAGTTSKKWLHADTRGSIIALSDASGNVVAKNTYDPYGTPDAGNSGLFQYTGQIWLTEAGIYHYKARAYHSGLGRFLQTDPIGYGDGMNMYAYVGNDPVNGRDPSGNFRLTNAFTNCYGDCRGSNYFNVSYQSYKAERFRALLNGNATRHTAPVDPKVFGYLAAYQAARDARKISNSISAGAKEAARNAKGSSSASFSGTIAGNFGNFANHTSNNDVWNWVGDLGYNCILCNTTILTGASDGDKEGEQETVRVCRGYHDGDVICEDLPKPKDHKMSPDEFANAACIGLATATCFLTRNTTACGVALGYCAADQEERRRRRQEEENK